ncbi:MAG: GDSL-type esterase/lipase family protein [bacterium]|nr:GDSL-type esterase/lipase family protein [bacterium]
MKKILCFGDSNTWGHNPIDCSKLEMPWPAVLRKLLPDCEIIENGVCGRTTVFDDPTAAGKNGITAFRELIRNNERADLAVIMLGTNDTLNFYDCDASGSAEAVRSFVREWKEAFNDSRVLVISPIEIKESALAHPIFGTLYNKSSIEKSKAFAEYYSKMAEEENVYFMDAAKAAEASDIDGIHMIPAEHEKLARAVYDKIKEII